MIRRCFEEQLISPNKYDWVVTVKKDLSDFDIKKSFEEIGEMSAM